MVFFELFLKKEIKDKYNPSNKLFKIEKYDKNKRFCFKDKYSYKFYNYRIKTSKNLIEIEVFLIDNKKVVNKYKIDKKKFCEY